VNGWQCSGINNSGLAVVVAQDRGEFLERFEFVVLQKSQGTIMLGVLESCTKTGGCGHDGLCCGGKRSMYLGGEPGNSVGDAYSSGVKHPDSETTIALQSRTNVKSFFGMHSPRCSGIGVFMHKYTCTKRGDGRAIVIERAKDLCMRRQFGIDTRASKKIQRKLGLLEEIVPVLQRKVGVRTTQNTDEMVFGGTNGSFCCIAPMRLGRDELVVDSFGRQKFFEVCGSFIVEFLKLGLEAGRFQA